MPDRNQRPISPAGRGMSGHIAGMTFNRTRHDSPAGDSEHRDGEPRGGTDRTDEHSQSHSGTAARSEGPGHVSRALLNFWLDVSLLLILVAQGVSAVIVQFVFPPGIAARGWMLAGMTYGQWCSIQFSLLSLFGTAILVHVMLHWSWICGVTARRILRRREIPGDGTRTVYGVAFLIVVLMCAGACVGTAFLAIEEPGQGSGR